MNRPMKMISKTRYTKKDDDMKRENDVSIDIKTYIINFIKESINTSKLGYDIINTEEKMQEITSEYDMLPNYNGINCFMVFLRHERKYYSYIVDRRCINPKIDISLININRVKVRGDMNMYRGTIFDGIYITKDRNTYILNDCYRLCGDDLTKFTMKNRNMNVSSYVKYKINQASILSDVHIEMNQIINLRDIQKLVNMEIELFMSNYIKGIDFYPKKLGKKLVFLYSQIVTTNVEEKEEEIIIPTEYEGIFEMKSTDIVDVYKLYLLVKQNGKIKKKNVGNPFIGSMEDSKRWRELVGTGKIKVHCVYNEVKNKWIPMEETDERPYYYNEIYRNIT